MNINLGGDIFKSLFDCINGFNMTNAEKERLKKQLEGVSLEAIKTMNVAQTEINTAEASNPKIFVSGWRPFIGWICAVGILWAYVLYPLMCFIIGYLYPNVRIPQVANGHLIELTVSMLGLSGLRTFEKKTGVDSK